MDDQHQMTIKVEISACTSRLEEYQREAFDTLPEYLKAKGFETDVFYREPGGRGPGPLEVITVFFPLLMEGLATNAIYDCIKLVALWVRKEYFKRRPKEYLRKDKEGEYVLVPLYAADGSVLMRVEVYEDHEKVLEISRKAYSAAGKIQNWIRASQRRESGC
ncbi:hypothetical protein [Corynebacterium matruchotii]|uniref:hypothetical protein n=1 Tax=Corynebacterium matruchotii TaxID=43768 RepID=UPI00055735AF|nr:hypothetical protein [Corynebacterium matruchotii]